MSDDYDAERAEAERLINEINSLQNAIQRAIYENEQLTEELSYLMAALGTLTAQAARMSNVVTSDVSDLVSRVSVQEVEARDLLQELRDLSERYFTYKNLSTATKNATRYTDEYYTKYSFYHGLRRITLGVVMAVDKHLISNETARTSLERAYLANTDYWLAYAAMAIMLWWSDEREAAERARSRALVMDDRKASLFFLFCNLKFGRRDTAARWYARYLGTIRADNVGEEYQHLLEAYLSGAFGSDPAFAREVAARFEEMFSEVTLYNVNFTRDVADAARRSLETKAHGTRFEFFYLAEYSADCAKMRATIEAAEKCILVAQDLERLAELTNDYEGVEDRLEDSIYHLVETMDPAEEEVWRRIKKNELIVAARGDLTKAEVAYQERYPEEPVVALGALLMRWALTDDERSVLPEVRRFAVRRLAEGIRMGYTAYAQAYRQSEQQRYELHVDDWSMSCQEGEVALAQASYNEQFDKDRYKTYLGDRFVQTSALIVVAGILGLVISALTTPVASIIVCSVMLVLAGVFMVWRRIADIDQSREMHRQKSMEIIERTLQEMGRWRAAYHEADEGFDALMQALSMLEEG